MLFVPTAQIMAADAQRQHLAGARFDGPVVDHRPSWLARFAGLFGRSAGTVRASTGGGRLAARTA